MKLKKLDDWWYLVSSHTSSIVVDDSPNPDQVNSDVGNYKMENQSEESSMQNSSCVSSVSETGMNTAVDYLTLRVSSSLTLSLCSQGLEWVDYPFG